MYQAKDQLPRPYEWLAKDELKCEKMSRLSTVSLLIKFVEKKVLLNKKYSIKTFHKKIFLQNEVYEMTIDLQWENV